MRVIITTEYINVDRQWLKWYLKRLANDEVMPGSVVIANELEETNFAQFTSKDPEGPVVATTTYEIKP